MFFPDSLGAIDDARLSRVSADRRTGTIEVWNDDPREDHRLLFSQ
jgi:hypothetical protein